MKHQKKILLIHTGGTFGMMVSSDSSEVKQTNKDYLGSLFSYVPELMKLAKLEIEIPINIDSSDITGEVWAEIAEIIQHRWDDFDGFVIIHGTDTMAYTSAALSYFLSSLTKPVVLTGSQRPLSELRSDASSNIIDAVELATVGIPEVMVCFHSKVYRGTRVTKFSTEHMQAFKAHNAPHLGHFGVRLDVNARVARRVVPEHARHRPVLDTRICCEVTSIDSVPGCLLSDTLIDAIIASSKGIMIRAFGAGNLPIEESHWFRLCEQAMNHRIPVVVATQCGAGAVYLNAYANGRAFLERGVISSYDMSFEAACVKLMVLLGRDIPYEKRHEFMKTPLSSEESRDILF